MRLTLKTTIAIVAGVLAFSISGCNSGGSTQANGTVTINGENGKIYSGTANAVTSEMGQDYAAGLRNMAQRSAPPAQ